MGNTNTAQFIKVFFINRSHLLISSFFLLHHRLPTSFLAPYIYICVCICVCIVWLKLYFFYTQKKSWSKELKSLRGVAKLPEILPMSSPDDDDDDDDDDSSHHYISRWQQNGLADDYELVWSTVGQRKWNSSNWPNVRAHRDGRVVCDHRDSCCAGLSCAPSAGREPTVSTVWKGVWWGWAFSIWMVTSNSAGRWAHVSYNKTLKISLFLKLSCKIFQGVRKHKNSWTDRIDRHNKFSDQ